MAAQHLVPHLVSLDGHSVDYKNRRHKVQSHVASQKCTQTASAESGIHSSHPKSHCPPHGVSQAAAKFYLNASVVVVADRPR